MKGFKNMNKRMRIDYPSTRLAVIDYMEEYHLLKFKLKEEYLPKVTSEYKLVFSFGNKISSPVETAVEKRIELESELKRYMDEMQEAFNRLSIEERQYLYYKFFSQPNGFMLDDDVQEKMLLALRGFKRTKEHAYKKFAIMLNIEVYKK